MDFYMARGLGALEIAAVHSFFSIWNPLNDICAGFLVDEWVARGFGSRLHLCFWAHVGYAGSTFFAFRENSSSSFVNMPIWLQYGLAISLSDGFAAVASAVNGLILIEQTSEDRQRIQIQRLNSIFGCVEWLVMSIAYQLWDPHHSKLFRLYLSAVCLLSCVTTYLATRFLDRTAQRPRSERALRQRLRSFMKTAWRHRNFWRYAMLTAVLEAEQVFVKGFEIIYIRGLLPSDLSKIFLMITEPLCGTLSFALTWLAERPDGVYLVTLKALQVRMLVSFLTCSLLFSLKLLDFKHTFHLSVTLACVICMLLATCRAATRPATNLSGIIFASVIQEHGLLTDEKVSEKGEKVSEDDAGKYWMLRAALVKPMNSLGPVLGSAVLADAQSKNRTSEIWWKCAAVPAVSGTDLSS